MLRRRRRRLARSRIAHAAPREQKLSLSGNFLTSVSSLADLVAHGLRVLDISRNAVVSLSDVLGACPDGCQLEELSAAHNRLSRVPGAVRRQRRLLASTSTAGAQIGAKLPSLVSLDLSFNPLETLEDVVRPPSAAPLGADSRVQAPLFELESLVELSLIQCPVSDEVGYRSYALANMLLLLVSRSS